MKKIFIFASLLALAACSAEPYEEIQGADALRGEPLKFSVDMATDATRTTFINGEEGLNVRWNNEDKVGISATKNEEVVGVNFAYKILPIDGEPSSAQLKPETSSYQYFCGEVEGSTFRAYYPFAGVINRAWDGVVALPKEQSQAVANSPEHLGGYSFMKSLPYTVAEGESQINLQFYNIYSVVALDMSLLTPTLADMPIKKITLSGAEGCALSFDEATVNLQSTYEQDLVESPLTISAPNDHIEMILTTPMVLSENGQTLYFMVAPGTHAEGSLRLSVETTNQFAAEYTIAEGVTFEPNKVYHKSIQFNGEDFYFNGLKPSDLTSSDEVVLTFTMLKTDAASYGKTYVLPNAPTTSRPTATEIQLSGINIPTNSEIEGAVRDVYKWNIVSNGDDTYTVCHTDYDGTTYYLAQGEDSTDVFILSEEQIDATIHKTAWTISTSGLGYAMSATGERHIGVSSDGKYFTPWLNVSGYFSIYLITDHTSIKPNLIHTASEVTEGDYVILYNYRKTVDTDYIGYYALHHEIAAQNIVCRSIEACDIALVDGYVSFGNNIDDFVWTFKAASDAESCYTITHKANGSSLYINKTGTAMGIGSTPSNRTDKFIVLDTADYWGDTTLQMMPFDSSRYFGIYNWEGSLVWRSLSAVGSVYGNLILCKIQ